MKQHPVTKFFWLPKFKWPNKIKGQLPKTFVDDLQVYNYHLFSKLSAYLFVITVFVFPIALDLLNKYVLLLGQSSLVILVLKLISYGISFGWFIYEDRSKFIKSGAWAIYLFFAMPQIVGIILGVILAAIFGQEFVTKNEPIINFNLQTIAHFITIALVLIFSKQLFSRMMNTMYYNILLVLVVLILAASVGYMISWGSQIINKAINSSKLAENEATIREMFKTIPGKITIFFAAVLAAPLVEELAFRHSFFMLSRNRWVGFIGSTILFSWVHVSGDPNSIFAYLGSSIVFSSLFLISRENVTYPFLLHFINNLVLIMIQIIGTSISQ